MNDSDICTCEGAGHTAMKNMTNDELVASLQASDNDMFYWFDLHNAEPEDVVTRLLSLVSKQ